MDKFIEYAPCIIVVLGFLIAYKIFVTPAQLEKELNLFKENLDNIYVRKEVHNVIISEIKEDIAEIKEKLDVIYNAIINNKGNK